MKNTPGRIRTCDRRIRNPLLYPAELRAHSAAPGPVRSSPGWRLPAVELRPAGFEPAACGLGNRRSIHLSYERVVLSAVIFSHRRVWCQRICNAFRRNAGSEPSAITWQMPSPLLRETGWMSPEVSESDLN